MTLQDIRNKAYEAFMVGVAAADPAVALEKVFENEPLPPLNNGKYIIVAVGKAACKMAQSALDALPEGANSEAIAVTNYENVIEIKGCRVFGAAHPVPDNNGLEAANEVIDLLEQATENDVVLALVSGGSSALLPAPVAGVTLRNKSDVNEVLLNSGFDIYQMNLVRQSLSRLKGGGMLRYAAPAKVQSYILSDVLGDDLRVVGSGPSIGPIGTVADARRLLIETGNFTKMPENVRDYLEHTFSKPIPVETGNATLICSNTQSMEAMATAADATPMQEPLIGDVNDAAKRVIDDVQAHADKGPFTLAYGGETTVQLKGTGRGGRNQELSLLVAQKAQEVGLMGTWCFLSGGTDGRDGPTDAAGGMVDGGSFERIAATGAEVADLLGNNDSYAALKLSGDLLMTGATGTNVADLQLFVMA